MSRGQSTMTITIASLVIAAVLALQVIVLPRLATDLVAEAPEFAHLVVPLGVLAVAAGVCVQLGALVVMGLALRAGRAGFFDENAVRWIDALTVLLAAATVIVLTAHLVLLDASAGGPAIGLLMLAAIVVGCVLVALLIRFRSLQAARLTLTS